MTQRYFITATGTGIGKTLVTTGLCTQLRASGKKVTALKPVISGYDAHDPQSDTALIMAASGVTRIDDVSPWRFAAPLSPNMAAEKESREVDFNAVVEFCQNAAADYVLVEGAGGVMAPINNSHTMLDLMGALNWPVILVAGTHLGSISHTLTALGALHMCGMKVKALVLSESENGVSIEDTLATLQHFIAREIPVVKIPRLATKLEMWKFVPDISWICNL